MFINPHMILCLYLEAVGFDESKEYFLFPPLLWDKNENTWKPKPESQLSYSTVLMSYRGLLNKFKMDVKRFGLHSLRSTKSSKNNY